MDFIYMLDGVMEVGNYRDTYLGIRMLKKIPVVAVYCPRGNAIYINVPIVSRFSHHLTMSALSLLSPALSAFSTSPTVSIEVVCLSERCFRKLILQIREDLASQRCLEHGNG